MNGSTQLRFRSMSRPFFGHGPFHGGALLGSSGQAILGQGVGAMVPTAVNAAARLDSLEAFSRLHPNESAQVGLTVTLQALEGLRAQIMAIENGAEDQNNMAGLQQALALLSSAELQRDTVNQMLTGGGEKTVEKTFLDALPVLGVAALIGIGGYLVFA